MEESIVKLRKKVLKNGKLSLYLDFHYKGKRNYEFLKIYITKEPITKAERDSNKANLAIAQQIRNLREQEIFSGLYGVNAGYKTNAYFLEFFENHAINMQTSEKNRGVWFSALQHLKHFCNKGPTFKQIDDQWLEDLKAYLLDNVKQNTAYTYFNKVRAALRVAYEKKYTPRLINVKGIKYEEVERAFLTVEELKRVKEAPCSCEVLKRAFLFSCLTGIRWSDIHALLWSNVNIVEGNHHLIFRQQKTKSIENLPINEDAAKLMGVKGEINDRVFKGLKYSAWHNLVLREWMLKAGITKHITFHCARHTHAYLLLKNGVDIYTVSQMLGHKNIKTTQVYAKFVDEMKIAAVQKIPDIGINNAD